jgi:hypothetical protein
MPHHVIKRAGLSIFALFAFALSPALSADVIVAPAFEPEASTWKYQITAYGWATSIDGRVGVAGLPPSPVHMPFSRILSHLDGALMSSIYATNGSWSLLGDVMWAKLSAKTNLNDLPNTLVEAAQKQLTASAFLGYRLPIGGSDLDVSAMVGLRYNRLTVDLNVQPGFLPLAFGRTWVKSWYDPIIGVTARYRINRDWFLTLIADLGGFGAGSRLTAQGFAAIGYNWNEQWSSSIGYRALYTDYRSNGFVYRVTQHGPIMTLAYRF